MSNKTQLVRQASEKEQESNVLKTLDENYVPSEEEVLFP